jgi:predicted amidohydrolase
MRPIFAAALLAALAAATPAERAVVIAVVQAGADHGRKGNPGPEANFTLLAGLAREAAAAAAPDLIVFPEYAISGWPYPKEDDFNALAETVPGDGKWFRRYAALAKETGRPILGWMLERHEGRLYNAAVLFGRDGRFAGKYRKVHANLGEQTWFGWSQGDSLEPIEHEGVRYGISICSDMWFPETVRVEELLGAHVVVHQSIADDMGHLVPARAFDSELPIVMAIFQGGSYAVDSRGRLLGKLPAESPGWKAFRLEPFKVRTESKYGGWIPKMGHQNLRNPKAYGVLTDPAARPPWTEVFVDKQGRPQTREQLIERFRGRYDAQDPR